MLSINTNMPSLIAQRSLNNSTQLLNQAIERMSTGFNINHASDNAANYSISTNMSTKIGAYQVAEDNVAMGLDLLNTANGSLDLISDKLSRLRALAEQAANGTYGEQSLKAINAEASAIIDEMLRTKNTTEYNGKKLFGETVGPDMSKLKVNSDGFIQDIKRRNTASMTSLESVDETKNLAKGTYSISSAEELAKLARMQNSGKITDGSEFVLGADIDLSAYDNWRPIGWEEGTVQTSNAFCGTFDGNGYTIRNLKINHNKLGAFGLFGCVEDANFKNLGIENVNISANIKDCIVGSIVGVINDNSEATFENCYGKDINITATKKEINNCQAGGLVGSSQYSANKSFTSVSFNSCYTENTTIKDLWWGYGGGIIGKSYDVTCYNCFSSEFDLNGVDSHFGGLIGVAFGMTDAVNCFAKGSLSNKGNVKTTSSIGGIVGGADGLIKDCYFEGTIKSIKSLQGDFEGGIAGGCIGGDPLYIENCSVNANIISQPQYTPIGGIAGCIDCEGGYVKNCSFNGTITGNAIVGEGVEGKLEVKDCTYNKSLSGELKAIGNDLGTYSNVTDMVLKTNLQVGIHGDKNSQIDFNTFLQFDELRALYINGLKQENTFEIIDNLSQKIRAIQTHLGSVENRLESALDEISTQYDNLTSSRSTLRDADIAEVSSEYIRQQILQQASATLMATANQSPSLALQLL